jgi:hypothetical protein
MPVLALSLLRMPDNYYTIAVSRSHLILYFKKLLLTAKFDISFKETGLKETRKEFTLPKSRLAPGDHFKLINAADYFRDHLN